MFDALKGLGSMAGMMKELPRIKAHVEQVKVRLEEMTVEADAGGGAVRAVVTGTLRVVTVEVDPAMLTGLVDAEDETDRALAQDLIAGAVNAALTKAREMAEAEMHAMATELGLPLPPGGLDGLLK